MIQTNSAPDSTGNTADSTVDSTCSSTVSSTVKFHDLKVANSDAMETTTSSVKYHDLSSTVPMATSTMCSSDSLATVSTETTELYQLPRQQAVPVAPDNGLPSSSSDACQQGGDTTTSESPSGENDQKLRDVISHSPSPNFGEIIKESIVETVSA